MGVSEHGAFHPCNSHVIICNRQRNHQWILGYLCFSDIQPNSHRPLHSAVAVISPWQCVDLKSIIISCCFESLFFAEQDHGSYNHHNIDTHLPLTCKKLWLCFPIPVKKNAISEGRCRKTIKIMRILPFSQHFPNIFPTLSQHFPNILRSFPTCSPPPPEVSPPWSDVASPHPPSLASLS
jgi:hypothetical protein